MREEYEKIKDESKTGFELTTDKGLVQTIEFALEIYLPREKRIPKEEKTREFLLNS